MGKMNYDTNDQVSMMLFCKEKHRRKRKLCKLKKKSKKYYDNYYNNNNSYCLNNNNNNNNCLNNNNNLESRNYKNNNKNKRKYSMNVFIESEYEATLLSCSTIKTKKTEITRYTINNSINISYVTDSDDTIDEITTNGDNKIISNNNNNTSSSSLINDNNNDNSSNNIEREINNDNIEDKKICDVFSVIEQEFFDKYFENETLFDDDDDGYRDDDDKINDDELEKLELPDDFKESLYMLYDNDDAKYVEYSLNSLRFWNINNITKTRNTENVNNIKSQAVIIGSYLEELIVIFNNHTSKEFKHKCPIDIVYIIAELAGNPIVWLRTQPGLNIFQWSPKSNWINKFVYYIHIHIHMYTYIYNII